MSIMNSSYLLLIFLVWPYLCLAAPDDGTKKLEEMINNTRALRALIQSDPHRPIYHFVGPERPAAAFDPSGAIYWKGKYHLGYAYKKILENGGRQLVWGHAVSTDLMHWTIYPDMLNVKDGDIEEAIFSGGSFLSKEGVPHVIYHGQGTAGNMIASSTDDDLKVWNKYKGNPVLKSPYPDELALGGKRCCIPPAKADYSVADPDAWYDKEADAYYQISGGMKPGLFKSRDMYEWEHLGRVVSGDDLMRYPFEDMACPDFFSLGDKSMLLFLGHVMGAQYYIGDFANDKFTPEQHGRMSWLGGAFYAPEQLKDDKGRNIIWGWIHDRVKPPHLPDYGWEGIMSLPRIVSLGGDGKTLQINPPEEVKAIRINELQENDFVLQPNTETTLKRSGKSIELKIEIAGGVRSPFGVKVFASPDGREETVIRYEPEREQLVVDFINSSISGPVSLSVFDPEKYDPSRSLVEQYAEKLVNVSEQRAPFKLEKGEVLKLDIFLDRSVLEVFANGRQVVTQVVYPELETSTGIKVFSGNEAVTVKNIQSWRMAETNIY